MVKKFFIVVFISISCPALSCPCDVSEHTDIKFPKLTTPSIPAEYYLASARSFERPVTGLQSNPQVLVHDYTGFPLPPIRFWFPSASGIPPGSPNILDSSHTRDITGIRKNRATRTLINRTQRTKVSISQSSSNEAEIASLQTPKRRKTLAQKIDTLPVNLIASSLSNNTAWLLFKSMVSGEMSIHETLKKNFYRGIYNLDFTRKKDLILQAVQTTFEKNDNILFLDSGTLPNDEQMNIFREAPLDNETGIFFIPPYSRLNQSERRKVETMIAQATGKNIFVSGKTLITYKPMALPEISLVIIHEETNFDFIMHHFVKSFFPQAYILWFTNKKPLENKDFFATTELRLSCFSSP